MNKKMIFYKISILSIIFITVIFNIDVKAMDREDKIGVLISNKEYQKELIKELENIHKYGDNTISSEGIDGEEINQVIKVDFVNKAIDDTAYQELLTNKLNELKNDFEKLEKDIEYETKSKLLEEGINYDKGCWPVNGYEEISSNFGYRNHPITNQVTFHKGIDIPAPEKTDIISTGDGIVVFSGVQNGYGNVVKIKHFDNRISVYAHNYLNLVENGDVVREGQKIARVGSTGDSTGNHVHFEIIVNDKNINPTLGIINDTNKK